MLDVAIVGGGPVGATVAALGDVDREDGGRTRRGPRARFLEPLAARVREREGAPVARGRRARLEELERKALTRGERRERRADRPGADDRDVDRGHQRSRTAASTSFTVFGQSAVRTSRPFAVTSTSSSMRTPMFQNALGTLSAGRM